MKELLIVEHNDRFFLVTQEFNKKVSNYRGNEIINQLEYHADMEEDCYEINQEAIHEKRRFWKNGCWG